MEVEWSNAKHRKQWRSTLEAYAFPHIGSMAVNDIQTEHIKLCLDPIWLTKTETARRVRQRIETIIDYAIANEYRKNRNPAIWKGHLDKFYPKPNKVKEAIYEQEGREKHLAALPYRDMPTFMTHLKGIEGMAVVALRFSILTAARSGEVRYATWTEFNLDRKEWNIPKSRMKARKAHRVALSDAAIELLKTLPRNDSYVFPGRKRGRPINNGGMLKTIQVLGYSDITVHGFRSTFRDYIGEETGFPHRLAEFALAHGLTDESEKAYARGDLLKKRFTMMNAWAAFVDSDRSNVTHISIRA